MRMTDLKPGWPVLGNDGRRLGTIRDVTQNYVFVSTATMSGDLHVPASAIGNVDNGVVHLNLPTADATSMGWDQAPRNEDPLESGESDLHRHI